MTGLVLLLAIIANEQPLEPYRGPPWQLDEHWYPVAVRIQERRPNPVKGHKWFRYSNVSRWGFGTGPGWKLIRMHDAPPMRRTEAEPWGTWTPRELDDSKEVDENGKVIE